MEITISAQSTNVDTFQILQSNTNHLSAAADQSGIDEETIENMNEKQEELKQNQEAISSYLRGDLEEEDPDLMAELEALEAQPAAAPAAKVPATALPSIVPLPSAPVGAPTAAAAASQSAEDDEMAAELAALGAEMN